MFWLSVSHSRNVSSLNVLVSVGASKYLDLPWKLCFLAIFSMQNYKIFFPSSSVIVAPWAKAKTSEFLSYNFSQYNFEKLIWTVFKFPFFSIKLSNFTSVLQFLSYTWCFLFKLEKYVAKKEYQNCNFSKLLMIFKEK